MHIYPIIQLIRSPRNYPVIGNPIQRIESSNDSEAEMKREISAASPHIMSASLKEMLESEKGCCTGGILNSADARFVSTSLLKTDMNCSWRILAISLNFVWMLPSLSKSKLIDCFCFE